MRVKQIGLALFGALAFTACAKDEGPFLAPEVPLAYTRFINAIPDTVATDWRFIDYLEYSPYAIQLAFRQFTPYQATAPGSRHLRVFTDPGGSPLLSDVTKILADEQITFEAGKYYSLVVVGFSRAGQTPALRLQVYEDAIPDAGSQVALRVVNLATGLASMNVGVTATYDAAIPAPTFANVAYLGAAAYVTRATGAAYLRVQETTSATEIIAPGGSGATLGANRLVPAGAAGDPLNQLTAIGGTGQAGSVITGWIFPRSVSGSKAPNVTTPSLVFTVDKHPR